MLICVIVSPLEVIIMRETKSIEFKAEVTHTFLKTVSAYSNYGSGIIYFGINDDGSIKGIDCPKVKCLDIENLINANIDPKPDYTLQIDEKTNVITLTVEEGLHKPYFYKNKAYKRNDSSTIEVDRLELTRLVLEGQNLSYEELKTKNQDLTFHILEDKLKKVLSIQQLNVDVLKTLELFSEANGYNNAAALLSDTNHFSGIDIVRFGDSINIMMDRETYNHQSILRQFDLSLEMFRKYYQYEKIEGSERKTIELIPEEAFREAIANALVHRDWDVDSNINVFMYKDHIEIVSPGTLPNGITKEEYLQGGISILRNPIIGMVFFRLNLIERFGTGIRRIMECYKDNIQKPTFEISEHVIRISLPLLKERCDMSEDQNIIYKQLKKKEMSISELSASTSFSKSKLLYVLKGMIEQGFVDIRGNGRGTKYCVR